MEIRHRTVTSDAEAAGRAWEAAFGPDGVTLDTLPVEYLFTLVGRPTDRPGKIEGGRMGNRFLFTVVSGEFEGPRLRGKLVEPSGDWGIQRADGGLNLDVRLALRTDDGHDIFMEYRGVVDGQRIHVGGLFEAGAGPYAWLNTRQYVGVGNRNSDATLSYRFYALA